MPPIERFCYLCKVYLRGREWLLESDCPTCEGVDSLKTPAEYRRFCELKEAGKTYDPSLKSRRGRPPKKSRGRSAADMQRCSVRRVTLSRFNAPAVTSKISKARSYKKGGGCSAAESMAHDTELMSLGLDEDLHGSCAGGSGTSDSIAEFLRDGEPAQMLGEMQVVSR